MSCTDTQRVTSTALFLVAVAAVSHFDFLLQFLAQLDFYLLPLLSSWACSQAVWPQAPSLSLLLGSTKEFPGPLFTGLPGFQLKRPVSPLLFLLKWTTAPRLLALVLMPHPRLCPLWPPLGFGTFGLLFCFPYLLQIPLLADCWFGKLCLSHLKHSTFSPPKLQTASVLGAFSCLELPCWKSSVTQAIQKMYRHKKNSVRILHLSLSRCQQLCNGGVFYVGDLPPPSPSKLETLGLYLMNFLLCPKYCGTYILCLLHST